MIHDLLNRIIGKAKGEAYELDKSIPAGYLLGMLAKRFMMALRGFLTFCKKDGVFFRGPFTTIKCRSKLHLGKSVTIEQGCYIDALSKNGIRFGNGTSIGKNSIIECTGNLRFLGEGLVTGDNVALGSGGFLGCAGGIQIGADTIIGNYVSFHSENHLFSRNDLPIRLQGVQHAGISIGKDCWIGAKVTVLDGAVVEDGCIIAAGALLVKNTYTKNGIYGGVPAKLIRQRFDK